MTGQESRYRIMATFAGPFAVVRTADGGLAATWLDLHCRPPALLDGAVEDRRLLPDLVGRLKRYFAGRPVDFSDVPTPAGGPFQRRCWSACRRIPPGRTRSYGQLAAMAGAPGAARAAGQAMRRNPLPVIIPCHRVVAADGRLHGYGGDVDPVSPSLAVKRALLGLESSAS